MPCTGKLKQPEAGRRSAASGETDLIERLRADLAEVEDIAGEEMRLYLTDLALERARLAFDVPSSVRNETESAAHQTASAEKLIAETITAAMANLRSCKPASKPPKPLRTCQHREA
jgi:phage/plasmid primase-like uncharacterized protein